MPSDGQHTAREAHGDVKTMRKMALQLQITTRRFQFKATELVKRPSKNKNKLSIRTAEEFGSGAARILELSDELLVKIANYVDGENRNTTLIDFALAIPSTQRVIQEVLICGGQVPITGLYGYIELLGQCPKWAKNITKVNIYQRENAVRWNGSWTDQNRTVDSESFAEFKFLRSKACKVSSTLKEEELHILHLTSAMMELTQKLPNLVSLELGTRSFPSTVTHFLCKMAMRGMMGGFPADSALAIQREPSVLDRLETLTIKHEHHMVCNPKDMLINLNHFRNLKVVTVPWQCLGVPYPPGSFVGFQRRGAGADRDRDPLAVLPPSLCILQVYSDRATLPLMWLRSLYYRRRDFTNLTTVRLYIRCTFATFLLHHKNEQLLTNLVETVKGFTRSNICLETAFLTDNRHYFSDDAVYYKSEAILELY